MEEITTVVGFMSVLAAAAAAFYAAKAVNEMKKQMKQLADQHLTQLSNEHNWDLYERHQKLPPALPVWRDLDETGWAWRVLHLSHLNLFWLAYKDYKRGLMDSADFESWKQKATYWFSGLAAADTDIDISKGRETLRHLIEHEEAFSPSFCRWLIDKGAFHLS